MVWKDPPAQHISERVLMDIARCVQDNFHIHPGIAALFAPLKNAQLPHVSRLFVTLLHDPLLFGHPVLAQDVDGNYLNERQEALRSEIAINLPVCSDRDEILALKIRLDRYPDRLEDGFARLLENAAPLLESLDLPISQEGLWSMPRSICDRAEACLRQATGRIRPEIYRTMA